MAASPREFAFDELEYKQARFYWESENIDPRKL